MDEQFSYEGLYRLLEERRAKRPEGSYTTYLFEKGLDKILKKVGEECTEVIIAAKSEENWHPERRGPWSRTAAPGAPVHLYRPNCQKATALAAATLREFTPRAMGMQTV